MLSGDNSVLKKAVDAREKTNSSNTKEQIQIAIMSTLSNGNVQIIDDALRAEIKKSIIGVTDNDITGNEKNGWQVKVANKAFAISNTGEVNEAFWEEVRDANGNVTEIKRVDGTVTGLKIGDVIGYSAIEGVNSENRVITSLGTVTGLGEGNNQTIEIEAGTWKLLGVENGKLKIISDIVGRSPESVETDAYANKVLRLSGKTGYQNAEEELNRVCSLYGKGKNAESGRSINVEDINKITGYNPNAVGIKNPTEEEIASGTKYGQGDNNPYQYGREVTYSWSGNTDKKPLYTYAGRTTSGTLGLAHDSFNWFDGHKWNISNYEAGKTGIICKLTSNYYLYLPTTLTDSSSGNIVGIANDSDEYKTLFNMENFGNTSREYYWLASKCIYTYNHWNEFHVRLVVGGSVDGSDLARSNGLEKSYSLGLRPVVYLKSDIRLKKDNNGVWQFVEK